MTRISSKKQNPMEVFGICEKKYEFRKWIYGTYGKLFGSSVVLNNCQYWTMCGLMSSCEEESKLQPNCELLHAVSSGFVSEENFHGVEINDHVFIKNNIATKGKLCKLYNGNIISIMSEECKKGNFNPGFINLDSIHEPKRAVFLLSSTLEILAARPINKVMIALNVVVSNFRKRVSERIPLSGRVGDPVISSLRDNQIFQNSIRYGWKMHEYGYLYGGTGPSSATQMCCYIFTYGV